MGGGAWIIVCFFLFLAQEACSFTVLGMIGGCFPGSPWFISFSYEVYSYALPSLYTVFSKSFFDGVPREFVNCFSSAHSGGSTFLNLF